MINNILVATDASAASNRALKMASRMAEQNNADLLIVHVIREMQIPFEIKEIPELESDTIDSYSEAREKIMRKVAEAILKEARHIAEQGGAGNIETAIGTGDPASGILGFAERRNMDLIVVGTRGLGKIKGSILGSVSRKIADNAETSCLIVR